MHAWIKLACVVLAWTILPAGLASAGEVRSVHPVQVSTRTSNISFTSARSAGQPAAALLSSETAAQPATTARAVNAQATTAPARTYVVQRGDTLSAIAARFGVRGGWPALYAANRSAIGANPDALDVGAVLRLPSPASPVRYTVAAGDTLSAIAARFGVRGGWPALYAANRSAIGADPDALSAGIRLTMPSPATSPDPGSAPANPAPSGTAPSGTAPSGTASGSPSHAQPASPAPSAVPSSPSTAHHNPPPAAHQSHSRPPAGTGMPSWLKTMLLAVGLLAVLIFAAEPLVLARRRRRRRGVVPAPAPNQPGSAREASPACEASPTRAANPAREAGSAHQVSPANPPTPQSASSPSEIPVMPSPAHEDRLEPVRIVMADHDRLVITRSKRDDTICVLRPPGGDPADILRLARLVLPEGHYGKLAEQLGLPANWPMNQ